METVRDLLTHHLLVWSQREGEIKTMLQFAEYLGVDYKALNHVFNGRNKLSERMAGRLAMALNDLKFYDLAELERPDPTTFYILRNLSKLNQSGARAVADEIAKHITDKPPD